MKNFTRKNKAAERKERKIKVGRVFGLILVFIVISGGVFFGLRFYGKELGIVQENSGKIGEDLSEEKNKMNIDEIVGNMTLEEKIGQMIVSPNPEKVRELNLGGLILMGEDMGTLEETRKLVFSLSEDEKTGVPRILATDQEGGIVQRLVGISDFYEKTGFSEIPEMFEIGKTGDLELARETGRKIAEQVKAVGLNMTFAPVLDVYSNPDNTGIGTRSFSSEAETVAEMGVNLGRGLDEGGVVGVYKHFPGHGDTAVDSHYNLPVVEKSLEELEMEELVPFRAAIQAGAKMIMVGHIALSEVTESRVPASLSAEIIQGILRERLGFSGLVITDGLNMGALTEEYSGEEIAVLAVKAGNDLLLMPVDEEEAIGAIKAAVERGEIIEEEITERVRKIIEFRAENF